MTLAQKLKPIFLTSVLFLIGILIFFIVKTYFSKQKLVEEIKKLPPIQFVDLNNRSFTEKNIPSGVPLIINYFNPSCEHCRYEAQELKKKMDDFKNVFIIMVSAELPDSIRDFGTRYNLSTESNIRFLHDAKGEFRIIFGSIMVPSFFLYDKNHRLIRIFEGETKTEALLNGIRE